MISANELVLADLEAKLAEAERERDEYRAKAEAHTRLGLPPSRSEAWSHYAGKMWGVLMERDNAVAKAAAAEAEARALRAQVPKCATCDRPATCLGVYEDPSGDDPRYGCDVCCGHGNEDGTCFRLPGAALAAPKVKP